jgi:mannose-6-phosphate isomerase-like protein (cupin superfamily)
MNISNIKNATHWLEVLQTTQKSQTAIMRLSPGKTSSDKKNSHKKSDQILLLLEGELEAEVGDEKSHLRAGDICLVPAGMPHRFENQGTLRAVTFNVYSPPEYSADEKG